MPLGSGTSRLKVVPAGCAGHVAVMNSFQANTAACASVAVGAGTDVSAGNAGNPGGGTVMEVCGADANPLAANAAWGADVVDVEVASPFFCSLHARTMRTNDTARVMTRLRRA